MHFVCILYHHSYEGKEYTEPAQQNSEAAEWNNNDFPNGSNDYQLLMLTGEWEYGKITNNGMDLQ